MSALGRWPTLINWSQSKINFSGHFINFMKSLLTVIFICFLFSACSSKKIHPYQVWSSLETPKVFGENKLWSFVMLDKEENIKQRFILKFTDVVVDTCASGEWKKIEIVNKFPEKHIGYLDQPAYSLKGAALTIDLASNVCDGGYELQGQIQEIGVFGEHYPVSIFGGEVQGKFYGVPVAIE